jgi:hypothetical protein
MSKFRCLCGHIIVDNGRFDHIKGLVLRDQSFDVAHEQPSETVAEFIQAIAEGRRKEWVEKFYGRPYFEISDSSLVFDIMSYARLRAGLDIYQCEACGRIYIEREPQQSSGSLRCFKPEDSDWRGTLAVQLPPESSTTTLPEQPPRRPWWRFW